jgi:hypothetical protein
MMPFWETYGLICRFQLNTNTNMKLGGLVKTAPRV